MIQSMSYGAFNPSITMQVFMADKAGRQQSERKALIATLKVLNAEEVHPQSKWKADTTWTDASFLTWGRWCGLVEPTQF